jgi:hypothetical protein
MSSGRVLGFGILGAVVGGATGTALGLLGGLGYTEVANVSGFEGLSGFVVGYWILGGLILGVIAGVPVAINLLNRREVDGQD